MAEMEKRTRPRISVDAAATLQVLGTAQSTNGVPIPVHVTDASERGMRVGSNTQLDAGLAVRLDIGDSMFLGEICYCAPAPTGAAASFHLGIVTEQCLTGLSGLRHLITALEPARSSKLERV
jgi:hypothetical protein